VPRPVNRKKMASARVIKGFGERRGPLISRYVVETSIPASYRRDISEAPEIAMT